MTAHHVVCLERPHGAEYLGRFSVDRAVSSVGRWFHGEQRHDLEKVILDYVAQTSSRLVERTAALDAKVFRKRDLYAGDVVAVPDRLEERVGKAEIQNVHDRFLAKEVIDAEYRIFDKH